MSAGEGWNPTLYLPNPMVAEIRLEFKKPYVEPDPDAVRLVFGDRGDTSFIEIEVSPYGQGEALAVELTLPMTLGTVEFSTGETIVEMKRELKDSRLYPAVLAMPQPFSNGWAFLSSSQATWPPGYTQTSNWHHFYGSGEGVVFDFPRPGLLITPAWAATEIFGPGNGFYPVYSATNGSAPAYAGESLAVAVRLEYVSLGHSLAVGETLSWALATLRRVGTSLSAGEAFSIDLQIMSMRTEASVGESVSLTLDVYDLVGLPGFAGETLQAALTTTSSLAVGMYSGEQHTPVATFHPASYMSMSLSTGEQFAPALSTKQEHRFATELGDGQAFALAVTLPVRADMVVAMSTGSTFAMPVFSTAVALGAITAYQGSSISVTSLDEVSNYKAADGASLSVTIEAYPYFSPVAGDGTNLAAALDTRPPAGMSCAFHVGEWASAESMNTRVAVPLRVTFCDGVFVEASDSTATTYYDLEGAPSYPNRLQWWLDMNQFEFIDMPPSFSWGSGPGVVVQVDLQARPRFSISCATGESFALERGYDYMEVTAQTGLMGREQEYFYIEPHINLCYPNVFPNTDAMEVELDFNEETCYADYLYEGQALRSALSCVYTVAPVWWEEGSHLDFVLSIYDLWRVQFWAGERLTCYLGTLPSLQINAHAGETILGRFEEPTIQVHTGEVMELALTISFDVEFLEMGCLDNEYKYMTPDGDEDKEKFNPVAVELEPFAHEIKARCF